MTLQRAVVIGGCGGFGQAFTRNLVQSNVAVTTVDVQGEPDIVCDVAQNPAILQQVLETVDLVLLCLDEDNCVPVLNALHQQFANALDNTLIVDICSVKTRVAATAEAVCPLAEYVSLHPMFAPDRKWPGNNAVFVPIRVAERAAAFRKLLGTWGLNVLDADVATHDHVTSLVQVLTHAVLATFANARQRFDVSEELINAFATPVFRDLDKVSQGMVGENPRLYHNIQTANPKGEAARLKLQAALAETLEILGNKDPEAVEELFLRVKR